MINNTITDEQNNLKKNFLFKCNLAKLNYSKLEKDFFKITKEFNLISNLGFQKNFNSMFLANLLTSLCINIEESLKLLIQSPMDNNCLLNELEEYYEKKGLRKQKKEVKNKNFTNIKIQNILELDTIKNIYQEVSNRKLYFYYDPPTFLSWNFKLIENKPGWFKAYEDIKHNIFTNFQKANIWHVYNALVFSYLTILLICYEASFVEKELFTNIEVKIGPYIKLSEREIVPCQKASWSQPFIPNMFRFFKSNYFCPFYIEKKEIKH